MTNPTDTEMLDWIERNKAWTVDIWHGYAVHWIRGNDLDCRTARGKTIRDAIRNAILDEENQETPK